MGYGRYMNNEPYVLDANCMGDAVECRRAFNAGRPAHVNPPMGSGVVMPTYHYATVEDGLATVRDAMDNAPMVTTDEELYRYRTYGIAYRLPEGWVDPDRRR